MTLKKIREVPDELPPAILYLDDIEEIRNILVEAVGEKKETPTYYFRDETTDSIEDLRQVGGSSTHFSLWVGSAHLTVDSFPNPRLSLYGIPQNKRAEVFQRVYAIFHNRARVLTHALRSLPWWFLVTVWVCLQLIDIPLGHLFRVANIQRPWTYLQWVPDLLILFLVYAYFFRPSRVRFVNYHQKSREAREERQRNLRDLAFLVIGAVLTVVVQLILKKLQ